MSRVLVTGGSGFIGSYIIEKLSRSSVEVLSLSHDMADHINCKQYIGDFGDKSLTNKLLKGVSSVVHLGWSSVPSKSMLNIQEDIYENVLKSINLFESCVGAGVKKVVFISSGGTVYGINNHDKIQETEPLYPISSYGITKVAVEKYLHLYAKNFSLDYTILRVSNAYGIGQNIQKGQGVIGSWIENIKKGDPIKLIGNGSEIRDYIHISDVVEAVVKSISINKPHQIINIGTGIGTSLNGLLSYITQVSKVKITKQNLPSRQFDVPRNVLDITKAENILQWRPSITIQQGVERLFNN